MKNSIKSLMAIGIGLLIALSPVVPFSSSIVYANAETTATKRAILNNAKVSINGNEPIYLQSYLVDGYNYVRAREVTNALNIKISPYHNGNGVFINSDLPMEDNTALEKITIESADVNLVKATIVFDGNSYENARCFNLHDRYYFKLDDFAKASDNNYEVIKELTEINAKSSVATKAMESETRLIDVTWIEETKTVNLNLVKKDMQAYFEELRGNKSSVVETPLNSDINTNTLPTETIQIEPQKPLTEPPVVGSILANILIDESKGAYINGEPNFDNYNTAYKTILPYSVGECTWYAYSRFYEVTGVNITDKENVYWSSNKNEDYIEKAKNCKDITGNKERESIIKYAIADWGTHVAFIEYVVYDNKGKPVDVYFSEGNNDRNSTYNPLKDGVIKKLPFNDFINMQDGFLGYIVIR